MLSLNCTATPGSAVTLRAQLGHEVFIPDGGFEHFECEAYATPCRPDERRCGGGTRRSRTSCWRKLW